MCCVAKAVFILAIYNGSKPCFCPFVSDIGNSIWFKHQISKHTSRGLLARGEICLYSFPTYLQGTACWGAICLYGLRTYLQRIDCKGCSLFPNFPKGDSWSVLDAAGLYSFKSYLQETVSPECSLSIWFQKHLYRDCCWACSQFIQFLNLFRNVSHSKSYLDYCHLYYIKDMFWSLCVIYR